MLLVVLSCGVVCVLGIVIFVTSVIRVVKGVLWVVSMPPRY